MTVSYLDTSAAFKLILPETESDALAHHVTHRRTLLSSALLTVELRCATDRIGHRELPPAAVNRLFKMCDIVSIDDRVIQRATEPFDPPQRSLDAIHLATAIRLDIPELEFCSYDRDQLKAAKAAGLRCVSPC